MESIVLNGREIAKRKLAEISDKVKELQAVTKEPLCLATLLVGDSKDSLLYARAIGNLLKKINVEHRALQFPESISETLLQKELYKLNQDSGVTGIMVFAPFPSHIRSRHIFQYLSAEKDVEARKTSCGIGNGVAAPTAAACLMLIEETGINFEGKVAVVVGRSDVVGKPAAILLIEKRSTVIVCNSKTQDLKGYVGKADILVVTVGAPNLIKGDWIKDGSIVIDVGENVVDGKLVGDVEFETAKKRAAYITPVPGGVGPLTNIALVNNLIALHRLHRTIPA